MTIEQFRERALSQVKSSADKNVWIDVGGLGVNFQTIYGNGTVKNGNKIRVG